MRRRTVTALLSFALLAGCSGGGGSTGSSGSVTPRVGPTGVSAPPSATATLAIVLPTRKKSSIGRATSFISAGAQSIGISVYSVNGLIQSSPPQQVVTLAATGPTCTTTAGATTCTASIVVPTGVDVFSVSTYASANGTGSSLGTGLSVPQTIYANSAHRVTLSVSGTIASIFLYTTSSSFVPGTPGTTLLVPVPLDPSGNPIVNPGPYATPITISSNLPRVTLDVNGGAQLSSISVASPNDVVTVHYDGTGGAGTATLTATTSATPPQVPSAPTGTTQVGIALTLVPLSLSAPSGPYASGASYLFDTNPGTESASLAIAAGGPASSVVSSAPSVATVSPSSGAGPFTITRVGVGSTVISVINASGAIQTTQVSVPLGTFAESLAITSSLANSSANTINLAVGSSGQLSLSGGSGLYSLAIDSCNPSFVNVSQNATGFSLVALQAPNACAITVTDGFTNLPAIIINSFGPIAPSSGSLSFTSGLGASYLQSVTLSGGFAPYAVQSVPAFLSATVHGGNPNQIDVYPTAAGTGVVTVNDALGQTANVTVTATTVTIPILSKRHQ